jgi:hypothetical protein
MRCACGGATRDKNVGNAMRHPNGCPGCMGANLLIAPGFRQVQFVAAKSACRFALGCRHLTRPEQVGSIPRLALERKNDHESELDFLESRLTEVAACGFLRAKES